MSRLKNRNRRVKLNLGKTAEPEIEQAVEVVSEPEAVETIVETPKVVEVAPVQVETVTIPKAVKPIPKLTFKIDPDLARAALHEVTDKAHVGTYISTEPTSESTAVITFDSLMPGYKSWTWVVMLSWLDQDHLTIDEVAMVPSETALIAPAWIPWSQRLEAGDVGIGDELPYRAVDPALTAGYAGVEEESVLEDTSNLKPLWWSLGLGRERILSQEGRELAATRWSQGEFAGSSIMARVAKANCSSCGFYLPLAGSLGSAFGACTNALSPADGKVVALNFGCGAHSETDVVEAQVPSLDLVYDDTYDQGLNVDGDDEESTH
jgi:hypothetical protein